MGILAGGAFLLDNELHWSFYPSLHLEVGPLETIRVEGGVGALGPLLDGRLFYAGVRIRFPGIDVRLGFAGIAHFVPDLIDEYNNEPFFYHGPFVLGGYVLCDLLLGERFFLHLGVVGASSPSMRLGIGVRL